MDLSYYISGSHVKHGFYKKKQKLKGETKMSNFGEISGIVRKPKTFRGPVTFSQGVAGVDVQVTKDSQIWYVDSAKTSPAASGNGLTWEQAFLTIAEALTAAGDGDVIYIGPGDYVIAATLAVTNSNLKIIGPNKSCNDYSALIYSSGAIDLMSIDANNVSVIGLGFSTAGGNGNGISISGTTASYKVYIAGCRFDGYGKVGTGIFCDTTQDSPDLVVEHNLFREWSVAAITHNATRAMYRNNFINVKAAGIGINCVPTGGNRPDSWVIDNYILGSNSTDTGIKIAATEPTDGTLLVANNVVANCNLNITQDKSNAGVVNNGTSGDGTAPLIVDAQA